jgi:hypothetical protein
VPLGLSKHQQEDVAQLERVAATNRVAVTLLLRSAAAAADAAGDNAAAAAGGGKAVQLPFKPLWEFGVHKWFPTLVLKSAAAAAAAGGGGGGGGEK